MDENTIIVVCGGTGCNSLESGKIIERLNQLIQEKGLPVKVKRTGCHGFCEVGPIVSIEPKKIFYSHVKPEDAEDIINAVESDSVVERLLLVENDNGEDKKRTTTDDIEFYKHQTRVVLARCGNMDPLDLNEYREKGGYGGLTRAVDIKPEDTINIIKDANLRGRGGGGFPTAMKWSFLAGAKDDTKYLVCNADEGDPGSFMDRTLMEGDPFAVVEGMTIAAWATGACKGFIYVRAEYPESVSMLKQAIRIAKENNLLGNNILGKEFNFDIEIKIGAGAFVCGEETALMRSVEGMRGMPRPKPPFPAQHGLWGKPTNINNVKTYAYASHIIREGAAWFKQWGTEKSPGTAVLSLTGKINNTGIVEVPMGTKLRDIIFKIGGGIKDGKKFKAVLTGGPSGGCLPESCLDLGTDYDDLVQAGSIMGSGGILVLDETDSMVDVAEYFLQFTMSESCGQCTPCREGLVRMHEIIDRIKSGKGTHDDLDLLEKLAHVIKDTSLCGLGQTAPNPVLTTLKYFRNEYEALLKPEFKYYHISHKCIGCGLCKKNCPVEAITGEPKEKHTIDDDKCIGCGKCYHNCPVQAIIFNKEGLKTDNKPIPD